MPPAGLPPPPPTTHTHTTTTHTHLVEVAAGAGPSAAIHAGFVAVHDTVVAGGTQDAGPSLAQEACAARQRTLGRAAPAGLEHPGCALPGGSAAQRALVLRRAAHLHSPDLPCSFHPPSRPGTGGPHLHAQAFQRAQALARELRPSAAAGEQTRALRLLPLHAAPKLTICIKAQGFRVRRQQAIAHPPEAAVAGRAMAAARPAPTRLRRSRGCLSFRWCIERSSEVQ